MPDTYKFTGPDGVERSFVGERPPTTDEMKQIQQAEAPSDVKPPTFMSRLIGAVVHPMTSVVPALATQDVPQTTLGDLLQSPKEALKNIGKSDAKELTTPALWWSMAAMKYGPKVADATVDALRSIPVRNAAATTLDVVAHPKMTLGKVADFIRPDPNASPAGVDRYLANSGGLPTSATPTPASTPIPYAPQTAPMPPKPHFSAMDMLRFQQLIKQGVSEPVAMQAILKYPAVRTP